MTVFFTSDTHWDHTRIIELCKRPFSSTEEMNETMIKRWNERVRVDDIVWHLGDFTMKGEDVATKFLSRLNGQIALIRGNHDRQSVVDMAAWDSVRDLVQINHQGKKIVLCHYAMKVWNESHRGSLMLYGHSHGTLPGNSQSLDVGVDAWDFRPVTLEEIMARLTTLPAYRVEDTTGLFTRAYQEGEKQ